MVEKPISAHKADAERLIAVRRQHPKQVFRRHVPDAHGSRATPKIKKLIADGELGQIVRFSWIITEWFRTEAYYASGGWRATWKGEGGGVLINQCLHQLDMLQWLLGMPARVRSFVQLGRFHHIEVEDNVTAYMEFPNGATGVLSPPPAKRPVRTDWRLVGEMGKLLLENDKLLFYRNEVSMFQQSKTSKLGFQKPAFGKSKFLLPRAGPACHADAKFCGRHSRRRAADRSRRRGHPFHRIGQRDALLRPDEPDD
jgi:predicted dehydrogenase